MLKKLFLLLMFAGIGWYCYDSGILHNLMHGMDPEPGRTCQVAGPIGEGSYLAADKDNLRHVIDSHIGTVQEKATGRIRVSGLVRDGGLLVVEDHSSVKVLANGKLRVLGYSYPITKVEVQDGAAEGQSGWVQREDVIDTPIQQLYQSMRGTKMQHSEESASEP